jgi:transposase
MQIKRVAIDTSKHVFTLHGVDERDCPVLRRELRRGQVEAFFAKLPASEVVLEACGGSHHWGRRLQALGHRVKLIPPQYVKPFVKRSKNDRIDAEAISEAAARPTMRFVPVKGIEEQAQASVLKVRELLVKQRTQLINALRGHAAEFGLVVATGAGNAARLCEQIGAAAQVPAAAKAALATLGREIVRLDEAIAGLDAGLKALHRNNPVSRLLAEIPGIGPLTALTAALTIDARQFKSGRHLAAWIGLTPKEHSTGGKHRLGAIGKQGNERLRQLLAVGAMAVIKVVQPGHRCASPWLLNLLGRKPRRLAAIALANKMARIIWAMMTSGEVYRQPPAAAA